MRTSEIREAVEKQLLISNRSITRSFIRKLSYKLEQHCVETGQRLGKSWNEILYITLYGKKVCKQCGNDLKFRSITDGYSTQYCSSLCAGADLAVVTKRRATCEEKYGVDSVQKVKSIRKKFLRTMVANHGVQYSAESDEIRERMKSTCLENYGVESPFQSQTIHKRIRKTMVARYGVPYNMQIREVFEKQQRAGFKIRKIKHQGKHFRLRGYEPEALKYMTSIGCDISNILHTAAEGVPSIKYKDELGEIHYYHPDFFVKRNDSWYIVEVKSTYTAGFRVDKSGLFSRLKSKAKATAAAGYKFILIVVGVDGTCSAIRNVHNKSRKQAISELRRSLRAECI